MSGNFQFLKKIDNGLYDIISDAEKLYKDEYFEQCIIQTRRFGEQICKNLMVQNNRQTGSFDEMLATLKDQSQGSVQEKEFIDDLYYLKQTGNQAAHTGKVKQSGMTALECLKRSFETAITYSVYNMGASSNILKLNYDTELLITDKKSKKSLKEKYQEAKKAQKPEVEKYTKKPISTVQNNINFPQKTIKKAIPFFWKFIGILTCISMAAISFLATAVFIKLHFLH